MNTSIATNIRALRKGRRLTQEQLAEALGVTVGAVSKWESGSSTPDVSLIMDMAAFFETSVDRMLGFDLRSDGASKAVERIKALRNAKSFEAASAEAERALQKYPNSFEVAYGSAIQYSMRGVEEKSQNAFRRAMSLFERSLELIGQNKNEQINEWSIKNQIASLYLFMQQTDQALALLKANNADGLNNGEIGFTIAGSRNTPDEALPYLSSALLDDVTKLLRVTVGFANAYGQQNDHDAVLGVTQWMRGLVTGLMVPGRVTYLDKVNAELLSLCSAAAAAMNRPEDAKAYLMEAIDAAKRFDAAPVYKFEGTRFYHATKDYVAFDDFGSTAMEGIGDVLRSNDQNEELIALWEKSRAIADKK